MDMTSATWQSRLSRPELPRSNRYDAEWVLENKMGPHPLWLVESLCNFIAPSPASTVLDLGCGKALTSVFLAREFDVRVVAADWWISPEDNRERIAATGVGDQVIPLRAEAHSLPFASGQFDAIVSVDAYHYFGTADLYVSEMRKILRPGGWLGIVVPGLREEQPVLPPESLSPYWEWDFCSFHSPDWWRHHWAKTGLVAVKGAWWLDGGHDLWLQWGATVDDWSRSKGRAAYGKEVALLEADKDHLLGFTVVVAENPPDA